VNATLAAIAAGRFDKAVLARRVTAALPRPANLGRIVHELTRRYAECNVFTLPYGVATVLAASPERLAVKRGSSIVSHALAGTARRDGQPQRDADLAEALFACQKERDEHAFVVDAIVATLGALCDTIDAPASPTVMRLHNVQHLWTPISGRLRSGVSLLEAVARLHPTPAVAGYPRDAAMAWLGEIGERRGGCYSGVAGWIDGDGDGEAAVILRSALIEGTTVSLWAGAGIVAGSQPAEELAETDLKMAALLDVLALP
jgi:isochorismate synthase